MDPGAVPGVSTIYIWGRNRIDTRSKGKTFVRYGSIVIGLNIVNGKVKLANSNHKGAAGFVFNTTPVAAAA